MTVGIKEMYWYYKKGFKQGISRENYTLIVLEFFLFIVNRIWEGNIVKLPEKLGTIEIRGKKVKPVINEETGLIEGVNKDWYNSKKYNTDIYLLNEHTQGVRYKYFWSKKNIYLKYKDIFNFVMSRANRRYLAKLLKNGKEYYVTI